MIKEKLINWAIAAVLSLVTYFSPTYSTIGLVFFFVLCDLVTGLVKARKNNEEISSRKLRSTMSKFLVYVVAILVSHVIQQVYFPSVNCLQIASGAIAFIELKSIDENIKAITGFSLFGFVLDKLKPKV